MAKYRAERVKQEIMREVNDILKKRVRDPRVQDVTLTDIDLTGDLQEATIYYSTLSKLASDREKTQQGLDKASGLIRSELGSRLQIYSTPTIEFKRDESIEYGERIDQLLASLNKKDNQPMADGDSHPDSEV